MMDAPIAEADKLRATARLMLCHGWDGRHVAGAVRAWERGRGEDAPAKIHELAVAGSRPSASEDCAPLVAVGGGPGSAGPASGMRRGDGIWPEAAWTDRLPGPAFVNQLGRKLQRSGSPPDEPVRGPSLGDTDARLLDWQGRGDAGGWSVGVRAAGAGNRLRREPHGFRDVSVGELPRCVQVARGQCCLIGRAGFIDGSKARP